MALVERLADDLLLMSHGRAVLQGSVKDVLAQHRQGEEQPDLHDIYLGAVRSSGGFVNGDSANGESHDG
jgi:ABC-type glutathione transport system ATPase component